MPFVHVTDDGLLAHGPQSPIAADTQDHLLADAHIVIAAIEPGGDLAIVGIVGRDIGVEQVKRDAAHLHAPDAGPDVAARHGGADEERCAIGLGFRYERQIIKVVLGIAFLLPAVDVEILAEIALPIHEADAGQRNAQVGRGTGNDRRQAAPGRRMGRLPFDVRRFAEK